MKWFLLNASDVSSCVADAAPRHAECAGGNLSVSWNVAHTQALVKVAGADDDWLAGKAWAANALDVYTDETHARIFEWWYSPEWQPEVFL